MWIDFRRFSSPSMRSSSCVWMILLAGCGEDLCGHFSTACSFCLANAIDLLHWLVVYKIIHSTNELNRMRSPASNNWCPRLWVYKGSNHSYSFFSIAQGRISFPKILIPSRRNNIAWKFQTLVCSCVHFWGSWQEARTCCRLCQCKPSLIYLSLVHAYRKTSCEAGSPWHCTRHQYPLWCDASHQYLTKRSHSLLSGYGARCTLFLVAIVSFREEDLFCSQITNRGSSCSNLRGFCGVIRVCPSSLYAGLISREMLIPALSCSHRSSLADILLSHQICLSDRQVDSNLDHQWISLDTGIADAVHQIEGSP